MRVSFQKHRNAIDRIMMGKECRTTDTQQSLRLFTVLPCFLFGFLNFTLSMALAFLAFGLWLRLGRLGRTKLRAALFVPLSFILFLTHAFGWGTLGLLAFSAEAGAVLAAAPEEDRRALASYGRVLGAAFQIADDLLDIQGEAATLGKATGKDAAAHADTIGLTMLGRTLADGQRHETRWEAERLDGTVAHVRAAAVAAGRDPELHALMAPRPFLVSGGTADLPERWAALNHSIAVNKLLGFEHRVGMTNRDEHSPSEKANEQVYRFFEWWLRADSKTSQ